jgi:hypothetical protein
MITPGGNHMIIRILKLKQIALINVLFMALLTGLILCAISMANASTPGNLTWSKTYGGSQDDGANGIARTSDGGYILTGYTSSYGTGLSVNGTSNLWLVKMDANGKEEWNRTFAEDVGHAVVQTGDGGYVVTGSETLYTNGSIGTFLLKNDGNGNLLWERVYGNGYQDAGYSLAKTSDGGFVIAGFVFMPNKSGWNLSVIKTDNNGLVQWNRTYGGALKDCGHSIIQTTDGGYAITGYTKSYSKNPGGDFGVGKEDLWLLKLDSNGYEQWNRTYGGKDYDDGFSILQAPDGGYVIAGTTQSFTKNGTPIQAYSTNDTARVYLLKTDATGNLLWSKTFGGDMNSAAFSIVGSADGNYMVTGVVFTNDSGSNVFALEVNSTGIGVWAKTYGGYADDYGYSVVNSSDNGYAIVGYTRSYGNGGSDVFLLKIDGSSIVTSPTPTASGSMLASLAIIPIAIMGAILLTRIIGRKSK